MGQVPIKGKHTHRYENGDVYDGLWDNSQKHGPGAVMTFANGDVYTGSYSFDKKHGEGTMTYNSTTQNDQNSTLPGYIPNNQLSFRNRVWQRAQQWRQQQNELANVYLGIYEGLFLSDCRNAFGTFSYSNHSFFFGEWSQDTRSGLGVLVSSTLDEFEGLFNTNSMHGWGTMKYNCIDREAMNQSISIRKNVLKFQVMAHLYKNKFKKPLPRQYKLPLTFLLDGMTHDASLASSLSLSGSNSGYISTLTTNQGPNTLSISSTSPLQSSSTTASDEQFLDIGIADIGAFIKPPQAVQQSQIVRELLDFSLTTLQKKQFLMQKYDTLLFITHELEVEGYWVKNQLTGPLDSTEQAKIPSKQEGNLNGFCIVKKFTPLNDDNAPQYYQLQHELQQAYHNSDLNNHDGQVMKYATIVTQQSVQYFVEIRIVNIVLARRIVETYGKVDLDLIELEISEDMNIADDEFDDILSGSASGGVNNDHNNNNKDKENNINNNKNINNNNNNDKTKKLTTISSPEAALSPEGGDGAAFTMSFRSPQKTPKQPQHLEHALAVGANNHQNEGDNNTIKASSLNQSSNLNLLQTSSSSSHTKVISSTPIVSPQITNTISAGYDLQDQYDDFEALAPMINLDSDDEDDKKKNKNKNNDKKINEKNINASHGSNPNNNNEIEITLDLNDFNDDHHLYNDDNQGAHGANDQGAFSMKAIQDAVNRVEAMFGNEDQDSGNFAIGEDE